MSVDPSGSIRRRRRCLSPSEKYELYLQVLTGQATQREAAERWRVDRSTVVHICRVAKQGALDASVPGRPGQSGEQAAMASRDMKPRSLVAGYSHRTFSRTQIHLKPGHQHTLNPIDHNEPGKPDITPKGADDLPAYPRIRVRDHVAEDHPRAGLDNTTTAIPRTNQECATAPSGLDSAPVVRRRRPQPRRSRTTTGHLASQGDSRSGGRGQPAAPAGLG